MGIDEFWKLMQKVDQYALNEFDEDGAIEPLIQALSRLTETDIKDFQENLSKVLFDLDGEEYAYNAGDSGNSGDGFLYCRCFVVAKGESFYNHVLTKPKDMPKSIDQWLEPLLYVSSRAWAKATGNDEEDWDYITNVSYESGSNHNKW